MYDDDLLYNTEEDEQNSFDELPLDEEEEIDAALGDFALPEEDLEGINKDLDEE